jgi:hypothetical protein
MATPSWAKWAKQLASCIPQDRAISKPSREGAFGARRVERRARTRLNPFDEPISEIGEENWPVLIEELYHKLRPRPPEQPELEKFLKRARKCKRPSLEVRFDRALSSTGLRPTARPRRLAAFRLIAALHWTVASLSEESTRPTAERKHVISSMNTSPDFENIPWCESNGFSLTDAHSLS